MSDSNLTRRTRPSLHNFVEDFRWAFRYARRYVSYENPLRHAWHYAYRVAPANRRKDRLKYG